MARLQLPAGGGTDAATDDPVMTAERFGAMPDGSPVFRVALAAEGIRVRVITFGAAVQALELPHADGWLNVVLGLTTLADYAARSPHFGAVPGRYAGRIAGGRFTLDGVEHVLPRNDGPNTRHGGPHGFGKRNWALLDDGPQHATLVLESGDGDAGFPGAMRAEVRYDAAPGCLRATYHATTTAPTVVNLTNHSYFNLAGEGSGSVLGHELTLEADRFTPLGPGSIPTGEIRDVSGTPFDFRTPHAFGARIGAADPQLAMGSGYDHAFLIRGDGLRRAALLRDPGSGRRLEVWTTEPALQLYTANMLDGTLTGPSGRAYAARDAVCLETQHLADSPNQPGFPSTTLRPGAVFSAVTEFRFGAG